MVVRITLLERSASVSASALQVAEHKSTSSQTLNQLAASVDVDVRIAVADNKHASLETLMRLAGDANADLRYAIAENHNIDPSVLHELVEDANPFVAYRARKTLLRLALEPAVPHAKLLFLVNGHRFTLPESQLNCPRPLW